jgi:hypothetical protein
MNSWTLPFEQSPLGGRDSEEDEGPVQTPAGSRETTPGGQEVVKWEVVAETMGLLPAQIIAGRLQSEGLPARAWQESAGLVHGLTIGPLGTGYVSVPESVAEQAREILLRAEEADEEWAETDEEE